MGRDLCGVACFSTNIQSRWDYLRCSYKRCHSLKGWIINYIPTSRPNFPSLVIEPKILPMKTLTFTLAFISIFLLSNAQTPSQWTSHGIGGGGALFSPSINRANHNE